VKRDPGAEALLTNAGPGFLGRVLGCRVSGNGGGQVNGAVCITHLLCKAADGLPSSKSAGDPEGVPEGG